MITLIKNYRNKETLRLVEQKEVADMIRNGEYQAQVEMFRRELPLMEHARRQSDGTLTGYVDWLTAESSSLASAEIISAISRMVSNISSHILSEADSSRVSAVASRKSAPMVS